MLQRLRISRPGGGEKSEQLRAEGVDLLEDLVFREAVRQRG